MQLQLVSDAAVDARREMFSRGVDAVGAEGRSTSVIEGQIRSEVETRGVVLLFELLVDEFQHHLPVPSSRVFQVAV
ncbi:MAG: hypothetical protein H6816_08685 [Phycisphaerales bacterium]|nr:hypothetical protein [Phycisphaerales bacterium]